MHRHRGAQLPASVPMMGCQPNLIDVWTTFLFKWRVLRGIAKFLRLIQKSFLCRPNRVLVFLRRTKGEKDMDKGLRAVTYTVMVTLEVT